MQVDSALITTDRSPILDWCPRDLPSVVIVEIRPAGGAALDAGMGLHLKWRISTQRTQRPVDGYCPVCTVDPLEFESDAGTYPVLVTGSVALVGGAGNWNVRAWKRSLRDDDTKNHWFWLTRSYGAQVPLVTPPGHTHMRVVAGQVSFGGKTVPVGDMPVPIEQLVGAEAAANSVIQTGVYI